MPKELTELHIDFALPSPEVMRAQRMAELEQLAKYRALKIQQYKDWSDPIKRAAIQARVKAEEEDARKILKDVFSGEDPETAYAKIAVRPLTSYPHPGLMMRPIFKPAPPKVHWFTRFLIWIGLIGKE